MTLQRGGEKRVYREEGDLFLPSHTLAEREKTYTRCELSSARLYERMQSCVCVWFVHTRERKRDRGGFLNALDEDLEKRASSRQLWRRVL